MRAFFLVKPDDDYGKVQTEVRVVPVPKPKSGQVLIRVTAAPINPSDYGIWGRSDTGGEEFVAKPAGKEGSGVVVASGGGMTANGMLGKNVGFVDVKSGGSYSEYVVCDASFGTFPLPDTVACEDAASHFINPYTVCGILDTARARHQGSKRPGLIHTAAASQVGQMMIKLCKQQNVTLINVVRRKEQVDILKSIGAEHIINSSSDNWEKELKNLMTELGVNVVFDAVAGDMSGKLLSLLPKGGTLFQYGKLSGQPCGGIEMTDLSYHKKKFEGWLLTNWILEFGKGLSTLMRLRAATACVHEGLSSTTGSGWAVSQFEDCDLDNLWAKFLDMKTSSGFTGRKLRLRFDVGGGSKANGEAPSE
jgi:NADPH:quinone reductase-like Zn-dependent oxidoreductase